MSQCWINWLSKSALVVPLVLLNACQSTPSPSQLDLGTKSHALVQDSYPPPSGIAIPTPTPTPESSQTDWNKPSGGKYPELYTGEHLWIDVSIQNQRVYIKDDDWTIYTMVTSSGLDTSPDTSTPRGTFQIEPEKGTWFYNKQEGQGARYFISWKNHGEFLFHSVAMDFHGNVIEKEAEKLGQKASHGCFRLTIPDAKWMYDHIPVKTKVIVHD